MTKPALPALALDGLEAVVFDTDGVHAAAWKRLFAVEIDGVEVDRLGLARKPDPALFLEAARRLGVAPGRRGGFGLVVEVDRGGQAAALAECGAAAGRGGS